MIQQPTPRTDKEVKRVTNDPEIDEFSYLRELAKHSRDLERELADAHTQIVALRGCIDHLQTNDWFTDLDSPYADVVCCLNISKVRTALSFQPPSVVSLEEHEKVKQHLLACCGEMAEAEETIRILTEQHHTKCVQCDSAEQDAERLANHLTYVTEQGRDVGGTCLWLHKDDDCAEAMLENSRKALAAHEARKGAAPKFKHGIASACFEGEGWVLYDKNGYPLEEWPKGWPETVNAAFLKAQGVEVAV